MSGEYKFRILYYVDKVSTMIIGICEVQHTTNNVYLGR